MDSKRLTVLELEEQELININFLFSTGEHYWEHKNPSRLTIKYIVRSTPYVIGSTRIILKNNSSLKDIYESLSNPTVHHIIALISLEYGSEEWHKIENSIVDFYYNQKEKNENQ